MTSMKEMRNLVGKLRESSYNSKKRKEIAREILEGRSLWGKVKNSFRDNWRSLCFAAAPFLTLGLLYEGTPHLIQKTVPLEYRDMNQDGIEDGIVVFPIHRSNGAIIGWVDGRKYPDPGFGNSKGEWYSEPLVVYRWDINKFNAEGVPAWYSNGSDKNGYTIMHAAFEDRDGDGKKNDLSLYVGCEGAADWKEYDNVFD